MKSSTARALLVLIVAFLCGSCPPAVARLQLTYTAAGWRQIARELQLDEQGAATRPAAAAAEKDYTLLVGVGLAAVSDDAPQRSVFPFAWLYYRKAIRETVDFDVWFGGVILRAGVGTNKVGDARNGWGWGLRLGAMPFLAGRQIYFAGESIDAETIGQGGVSLRGEIYRAPEILPGSKLGLFYTAGVHYFDTDDDTAPGFVIPSDTFTHEAGLFVRADSIDSRDRMGLPDNEFGMLVYGQAAVVHRQNWDPWGAPGAVRSTDDTCFKAHAGGLLVVTGFRPEDRWLMRMKGGVGSGLDRFSAFRVGSALLSDPVADTVRADALVRGFLGGQFLAQSYLAANLEYRMKLGQWFRLHLCLDAATFDQITPQTAGSDGTGGVVGVGFGISTGFFWESLLRFDYGVGLVGPEDGDTGIHEFRLSIVKRF